MDERELMRLFHAVEFERGDPYVQARDRLVQEGKRARPFLQRQLDDPDRGRVQAAEVVLGWMDHAEEYQRASDYLLRREQVPGPIGVLGPSERIPAAVRQMTARRKGHLLGGAERLS
jgi:hypothetical protein